MFYIDYLNILVNIQDIDIIFFTYSYTWNRNCFNKFRYTV